VIVFPRQRMTEIPEAMIQKIVLAQVNRIPGVRLWRMNTGKARMPDGSWVTFGIPGQADSTGYLRGGRRLEVELKTPVGRQSKEQKAYQRMIETGGGLYLLARTLEAAVVPICEAIGEEYVFEDER
jgi:hypothetical protein